MYVGQENDVLVISGPVFRNQFYLARFQPANERRQLRLMRAKQERAQNKTGYEKWVQMFEKFDFLSFNTIALTKKGTASKQNKRSFSDLRGIVCEARF